MKVTDAFIFTILLILASAVQSLNILGIFPYQGKSHFMVFKVYLSELANRGHNVTVISHFPLDNKTVNYKHISLAGSTEPIEDNTIVDRSYKTLLDTALFLVNTGKENCEVMLKNKQVQDMIADKPKFDVAVVEHFNSDCGLGIAYKLGTPVIGLMSHVLLPWHYARFGIPFNPSYVPFHFLEGGSKPSFFQRMERVFFHKLFNFLYLFVSQKNNDVTIAKYFDDVPPLDELARDIKFLLLYHNFVLTGSRLFPSNVIEVGGVHVNAAKPLSGDLKKFVDEANNGVIYISFGSVVKSSTLPTDKVQEVLEAMNEFPQRFIWKWEDKNLKFDKSKLFISDWLPQADILGHPKTLAFFSHAGMGGTTEAIHFGVPMVAMPVMGDQPSNAAAIEESGLGIQLQIKDLTKENLVAALKRVLAPEFNENVKKLSKAWHDRPMSPLDTAVFWTEFTARNSKFTFRSAAADVPFYQYLYLDVLAVFLVLVIIFIRIVRKSSTKISSESKKKPTAVKKLQKQRAKRD